MSDLISREELTKKLEYLCDCLCDYSKKQRKFMCDACKLGAVIDAVEEMPSVEPEQKTGKWISEERWCLPKCSVCGASCFGEHGFDAIKTPYCPTCGAEMEVN